MTSCFLDNSPYYVLLCNIRKHESLLYISGMFFILFSISLVPCSVTFKSPKKLRRSLLASGKTHLNTHLLNITDCNRDYFFLTKQIKNSRWHYFLKKISVFKSTVLTSTTYLCHSFSVRLYCDFYYWSQYHYRDCKDNGCPKKRSITHFSSNRCTLPCAPICRSSNWLVQCVIHGKPPSDFISIRNLNFLPDLIYFSFISSTAQSSKSQLHLQLLLPQLQLQL